MSLPKFKKGEIIIVNFSGKDEICLFEPQEIAKVIYRKNCWVYKLKGVSIHGDKYFEDIEESNIISKDEAKQIVLNYLNKFLGVK
jgi:hypothetical protein